jgi:hypothetical protein
LRVRNIEVGFKTNENIGIQYPRNGINIVQDMKTGFKTVEIRDPRRKSRLSAAIANINVRRIKVFRGLIVIKSAQRAFVLWFQTPTISNKILLLQ